MSDDLKFNEELLMKEVGSEEVDFNEIDIRDNLIFFVI